MAKAIRRKASAKATFAPFEPQNMVSSEEKMGKKDFYVELTDTLGKKHFAMSGELSQLQVENKDIKILINEQGEIAEEGKEFTINPDIRIGRNADGLLHVL